jgi:PKD repeat protein
MKVSFNTSFKSIKSLPIAVLLCSMLLFSISFAQQCTVIYVTPNGASSGTVGTKIAPASLTYALTLVSATNNKIFMASGTYNISSPITMKANLSIEGGYNSVTWKKSNATATTIFRDNSNIEPSPNRIVAMYCNNISNFRLQDLTIRTANGFGGGVSTYVVHLSGCSSYEIVRCKVVAGNAGNGTGGVNGISGMGGAAGLPGDDGADKDAAPRSGGLGGSGSFAGSYKGGTGGDGGDRGTAACQLCGDPTFATNGYAGQNGDSSGYGGGYGGAGGQKTVTCIYPTTPARTTLNDGGVGTDGADGTSGLIGVNGFATFAAGFYVPGNGVSGLTGTNGFGGGGGGGGGSIGGIPYDCLFGLPPDWNGTGAGGGGGGEGGQSGIGGTGGTGGGGSFAIYVYNNGANGIIKDTKMTSGISGLGGSGGTGGAGGLGGAGGARGGQGNANVGAGGDGGKGGAGGDGGQGGTGSDGITYTLYEDTTNTGTPITVQNVYSLQQPTVYVQYSGCTNAPVTFSTNASGTVIWFFGAGATPASGSGITSTTKYTTQGRKTFTMVNNGISYTYTDFIEIFSNGAGVVPSISTADTSVCIGHPGTYTCSPVSTDYTWYFIRNNVVDTVTGPAFQNATYTFDSAGTYLVVLKSVDYCCGESFPDTAIVHVGGIVYPSVSIASQNPVNIVCNGGSFSFSATAINAGVTPTYQWLVSGTAAGGSYPVFTSTSLVNADSIKCIVTSALGCSAGLKDTSNSIGVRVVSLPIATCSADSLVSGNPTQLISSVTSGGDAPYTYSWSFGDNASGVGDTVSHIYQLAGAYSYQVNVADSNGCIGSCSGSLIITSRLKASYTASASSGCAPLKVDFTSTSVYAITYHWNFGDGTSSTLQNPTHFYTNAGTYNVTLMAFGATGTDSSMVTSQILVHPTPVANFQSYISISGDTAYLADNSIDAWTWLWNFGDGGTSTIQNPYHVYSANGLYNISLIVSNGYGCIDTTSKPAFVKINVGVNELSLNSSVQIFPNPFSSEINIGISPEKESTITISLMNLEGVKIISEKKTIDKGMQQIKMNDFKDKLVPGMYLLQIEYNGKKHYTKLIYQE